MGDLRPDNNPPEDGGGARPGDLPEFPPEWGTIVIPDDASELDHEAAALRRELRRHHRRTRLRTALGVHQTGPDAPSLGVPVVIMAVAVITTLLSLFVVTWDRRPTLPVTSGTEGSPAAPIALVDVTLADAGGDSVRLGGMLPAVLLLADDCDCAGLIAAIAAEAPAPVTIVPIGRTAPCPVGTAPNVRCLSDPRGVVTSRYATASGSAAPSPSTGAASPSVASPSVAASASMAARTSAPAILVDSSGVAADPITVNTASDLNEALAKLVGG
jgi:hypothetical protein